MRVIAHMIQWPCRRSPSRRHGDGGRLLMARRTPTSVDELNHDGTRPFSVNDAEHRDITRRARMSLTLTGNDPVYIRGSRHPTRNDAVRVICSSRITLLSGMLLGGKWRHCDGTPGFHRCIPNSNSPSSD
jgi:hypothetical protein